MQPPLSLDKMITNEKDAFISVDREIPASDAFWDWLVFLSSQTEVNSLSDLLKLTSQAERTINRKKIARHFVQ